MLFLLYFER